MSRVEYNSVEDEIYINLTSFNDITPDEAIQIIEDNGEDIAALYEDIGTEIDAFSGTLRDAYNYTSLLERTYNLEQQVKELKESIGEEVVPELMRVRQLLLNM